MSVFTNPASSSKEQGKAYTAAILDLLGDRKPVDVLKRTEGALRKSIRGLSPKQLGKREAPGKWSIKHVLQHLADSELVWGWRLRMVLSHDRPPLTGYDQDLWADRLGYDSAKPDQALDEFAVLRRSNLRLVTRAAAEDLERVGVHAERGEESVAHMMRLYAGHDLLHLNQIERIRQSFSVA
jgi:DinB superfamily